MLNQKQKEILKRRLDHNIATQSQREGKLTMEQRESLVLEYLREDVSLAEIGRRYGITVPAVRYHIRKALA